MYDCDTRQPAGLFLGSRMDILGACSACSLSSLAAGLITVFVFDFLYFFCLVDVVCPVIDFLSACMASLILLEAGTGCIQQSDCSLW